MGVHAYKCPYCMVLTSKFYWNRLINPVYVKDDGIHTKNRIHSFYTCPKCKSDVHGEEVKRLVVDKNEIEHWF